METKYIRLLTYKGAERIINFVNSNSDHYACITCGGISVTTSEWIELENFIGTFAERYEISNNHPYKTEQNIVNNLKNCFEI